MGNGSPELFGKLVDESWQLKCRLENSIANENIHTLYRRALDAGAFGGKLLGAGGGGFLMFYASDPIKLRHALSEKMNLKELRFNFDFEGTKVLF